MYDMVIRRIWYNIWSIGLRPCALECVLAIELMANI